MKKLMMFTVIIAIIYPASASAQLKKRNDREQNSVRLGIMGISKPDYEGSDETEYRAFPMIEITYDRFFLSANRGLGLFLYRSRFINISTGVGYTFGRDEDDNSNLDGLGDIDDGAEIIANVGLKFGLLSFSGKYQKQFTGENTGYQCTYGIGFVIPLSRALIIRTSVNASWASDRYMEKYFGVNATQSANSGLAVYDTKSGFKSVGGGVMAIVKLSENFSTQLMFNYKRLIDDAADSPVVHDKNQMMVAIGFSQKF